MFHKSIEQLTFSDVQQFLAEGHRESLNLDYKQKLPDGFKIAALAAAFANTNGGFIVFGVSEQDELPIAPFDGSDLGSNVAQTINMACANYIKPQLEIICSNLLRNPADLNKAFFVVAIPQSGLAPHIVNKNDDSLVYIKISDHKEPVPPTLDHYQRLMDRRNSCDQAFDEFSEQCREDFHYKHKIDPNGHSRMPSTMGKADTALQVVVQVGRRWHDSELLATPQDIIKKLEEYQVHVDDPRGHEIYFPVLKNWKIVTFSEGIDVHEDYYPFLPIISRIDGRGMITCSVEIPLKQVVHCDSKGKKRKLWAGDPELIGSCITGMIKMGFQWHQTFGCYSAVSINLSFSWRPYEMLQEGFYLFEPTDLEEIDDSKGNIFGPGIPPQLQSTNVPWCSKFYCDEVARKFLNKFVSAFNVPNSEDVRRIISESLKRVDPFKKPLH